MAGQLVVSMPPLKRRVPGTASVPVAPAVPAAAPALRAELQTLRRAELRLDAALRPEEVVVAGRRGPPRPVPQMAPRQEIQGSFLRSHPSSGFVFDLDLKRFFIAWADICKETFPLCPWGVAAAIAGAWRCCSQGESHPVG
eukprot:Skav215684  [mRNA]  locus=scaffold278:233852:236514:- [translate_table: standard]